MSQPIQPSRRSSSWRYTRVRGPSVLSMVRERGVYGMVVAVAAMALGLSPTVFLVWWNWFRLTPVPIVGAAAGVQVKSGELSKEAKEDKPGETALLHVTCEVGRQGRWRELLQFEDEARYQPDDPMPPYVRNEQVYIRPTKRTNCPFGLLGQPPVSAWLPAGEYEVLVIYGGNSGFGNADSSKPSVYPLAREEIVQELAAGQRTDVRVQLPHHQACFDCSLTVRRDGEAALASGHDLLAAEVEPLLSAIEKNTCIPTPGGVLLDLPEPVIHHNEWHRLCEVDFQDLEHRPREWTRGQLQTLLDWLPRGAVKARQRLEEIDRSLAWRDYFGSWLWYATAGISGLAFARWATIAKLQPYRSRGAFAESLKLALAIFFFAILVWIVLSALSNGHWLRGIHVR